jgi:hypothetical protein
VRLSEAETTQELLFIDALFTANAVCEFVDTGEGKVVVHVLSHQRMTSYAFRPEHARILSRGIQKAVAGHDTLSRVLAPVVEQLARFADAVERPVQH